MTPPQVSGQETVESQPVDGSEEPDNDWGDAEEVFEEGLEASEEEAAPEGVKDSQLEADLPEYLKLDELKVPRKYKGDVQQWIKDKVVSALQKEKDEALKASGEETGQYKDLSHGLVGVLLEGAQNPERFAYYIEKYGDELGIDKALAKNFVKRVEAEQERNAQPAQNQTLQDIAAKYVDHMIAEQDPRVFMSYQVQLMGEAMAANENAMMGKIGHILKNYHEKYVAPDKASLKEMTDRASAEREVAEWNASKSSWSDAIKSLEGAHPEIKKHSKAISTFIQKSKSFKAAQDKLNEDPSDLQGRTELVEAAWLKIKSTLPVEKKPSKKPALPPSKHLSTAKKGGSDWEEIRNDPDLGWDN